MSPIKKHSRRDGDMATQKNGPDKPIAPGNPVPRTKAPELLTESGAGSVKGYKLMSSGDVINRIKPLGEGWDAELEGLLRLPQSLFFYEGSSTDCYSKDKSFSISVALRSLLDPTGPIDVPKDAYGIAVQEMPGSTYFILMDIGRRIIVRHRIGSLHHDPPRLPWSDVKNAINAALSAAGKTGLIIISDDSIITSRILGKKEPPSAS